MSFDHGSAQISALFDVFRANVDSNFMGRSALVPAFTRYVDISSFTRRRKPRPALTHNSSSPFYYSAMFFCLLFPFHPSTLLRESTISA
jgi:hypothetical protein